MKIIKLIGWLLVQIYELSGVPYILTKIRWGGLEDKRRHPTIVLWVLSIYFAGFGLASQRYENQLDSWEIKLQQLISSARSSKSRDAWQALADQYHAYLPYKPVMLEPKSVIQSWVDLAPYLEGRREIMRFLQLNKENLYRLHLIGFEFDQLDFSNANFSGSRILFSSFVQTNLVGIRIRQAEFGYSLFMDTEGANKILEYQGTPFQLILSEPSSSTANFRVSLLLRPGERTYTTHSYSRDGQKAVHHNIFVNPVVSSDECLFSRSVALFSQSESKKLEYKPRDLSQPSPEPQVFPSGSIEWHVRMSVEDAQKYPGNTGNAFVFTDNFGEHCRHLSPFAIWEEEALQLWSQFEFRELQPLREYEFESHVPVTAHPFRIRLSGVMAEDVASGVIDKEELHRRAKAWQEEYRSRAINPINSSGERAD